MLNLWSFAGLFALIAIAWLCSEARRAVRWKPVAAALALQLAIGALVFLVPGAPRVFLWLNDAVVALLDASQGGIEYVFGSLARQDGPAGFILAFRILPIAVFVSALAAAGYRLGLIQPLVRVFARLFHRTLGLSGAEALSAGANVFVGVEAALVVRPWLERMTRSELLVVLATGMGTTASTVLAFYTMMLTPVLATAAGHLISATIIAIPASVLVAKLLVPERESPATAEGLPADDADDPARRGSVIGALMTGGMDGMRLAVGIAVGLIAILGVVGIADLALAQLVHLGVARPPHLADLLTWAAYPFAALLGVGPDDIAPCARLLGERAVMSELVAYQHLPKLAASHEISERGLLIMSYALCGFAHVASVAVFVGGTAAVVPSRRDDLARLGPRALLAATLATLMTGCIAGVFAR
jgi:CNT family concentrative nucleoside transporter